MGTVVHAGSGAGIVVATGARAQFGRSPQAWAPPTTSTSSSLRRPSHWDIRFIRSFMFSFGPLSSVFDFGTFAVMRWVFHAGPAQFRSGWFVESLATQTLVIFAIRTRGIPFFRSHPNLPLTLAALGAVTVRTLVPATPLAHTLGYFAALAAMVLCYLALIELGKRIFYRAVDAALPPHGGPTATITCACVPAGSGSPRNRRSTDPRPATYTVRKRWKPLSNRPSEPGQRRVCGLRLVTYRCARLAKDLVGRIRGCRGALDPGVDIRDLRTRTYRELRKIAMPKTGSQYNDRLAPTDGRVCGYCARAIPAGEAVTALVPDSSAMAPQDAIMDGQRLVTACGSDHLSVLGADDRRLGGGAVARVIVPGQHRAWYAECDPIRIARASENVGAAGGRGVGLERPRGSHPDCPARRPAVADRAVTSLANPGNNGDRTVHR